MYENLFSKRIAELRIQKGVSARDMSLSIGQNPGYINNIENGKALPSMTSFFFICEYLGITPMDFFDFQNQNPQNALHINDNLKKLKPEHLKIIMELIDVLAK